MDDPLLSDVRAPRRPRGDDGSMLLAIVMIFTVTALVVGVMATLGAGQSKTRQADRYTNAVQGADAGVQQAIVQINQTPLVDTSQTLSGSSTIADATYTWNAQKPAGSLEWTVTSAGTRALSGSTTRTVVAKLKQQPLFPLAAFADTTIGFNGNNAAVSYPVTGFGVVGSNGTLAMKNNTVADGAVLYDFAANPNTGRCQNSPCDTDLTTIDDRLDIKGASSTGGFIAAQLAACKAAEPGGALPAFVGTSIGPKPDGSPHCFSSFHADSQNFLVTGSGPVRIFVEGAVTLGNKNHSEVNFGVPSSPDSIRLQIYSTGSSVSMYNQSTMAVAVYAPNATCGGVTSNAGSDFYGSLVCDVIDNVGGWTFHYDTRLGTLGNGEYGLSEYNEG